MAEPRSPRGFDRVAPFYRAMEAIALGSTLQRARTYGLDRLGGCRDILVIGDGNGRGLAAMLRAAPLARVVSIDASPAMLARAQARARAAGSLDRVHFACADVRTLVWPAGRYDAIVTAFVLDCFVEADVTALMAAMAPALRPGGCWLFADFHVPASGWRRWHAALWVDGLYAFFHRVTGIAARRLAPFDAIFRAQGFRAEMRRAWRADLVRAVVWRRE